MLEDSRHQMKLITGERYDMDALVFERWDGNQIGLPYEPRDFFQIDPEAVTGVYRGPVGNYGELLEPLFSDAEPCECRKLNRKRNHEYQRWSDAVRRRAE